MPTVGQQVKLQQEWVFPLHREYRNRTLLHLFLEPDQFTDYGYPKLYENDHLRGRHDRGEPLPPVQVTLPRYTVLQIDRIFLRKSKEDFDSITFVIIDCPNGNMKAWRKGATAKFPTGIVRFWAKLSDINGLEIELVENIPIAVDITNKPIHERFP